jgi:hypothetical protein
VVIFHGLIKTFKLELYLIIVLSLMLLPRFTLTFGFLCRVLYLGMREGTLVTSKAFVAPGVLQLVSKQALDSRKRQDLK